MKSVQGKTGGYVLTRAAAEITVLDVVQAVDGASPAFVCTEIRQRGPLGTPAEDCTESCPIARGPEALPGIGVWLTSVSGSDG
ncbi:Rrf2 family transcriptional regulator [Streptomyces sp. NPDC050844]|uniref:Rrf2 family transcriptional regulator n=1 Tax=Streptomyces sp. NPDC050844 TaxID=3155790 RepID=UPI0033F22E02